MNTLTLTPAPGVDPVGLPLLDHVDGRRVLTFTEPIGLGMEWSSATLVDGRTVEVRRSACGLGCFCAGEFRWSQ